MPQIPAGWKETTLGEVSDITSSKRIFANEYKTSWIPFFRGKEITEKFYGNSISTELFISEERYKELEKTVWVPQEGDILLTSVWTLGNPYLVEKGMKFYFKDWNITRFHNFKDVSPKWLFYRIISPIGKEILSHAKIGSTQQAYTIISLKQLPILLPHLPEQQAIAAVLSSFDDKIELLRAENQTLEQMGQELFKERFGAPQPPKGGAHFSHPAEGWAHSGALGAEGKSPSGDLGASLPEGWRVGKIEDLTNYIASWGTPATKEASYYGWRINWFSTKELQDSFLFSSEKTITEDALKNSSAKEFPKDTVLMAIYAAPTVWRLWILTQSSAFNQAAVGLVAKDDIWMPFIYLLLKFHRDNFNNLANWAAQQNLNVSLVKNYEIPIPEQETLSKFDLVIKPLFNKIKQNSEQIQTLSATRDQLLPKLMSGEVRVEF